MTACRLPFLNRVFFSVLVRDSMVLPISESAIGWNLLQFRGLNNAEGFSCSLQLRGLVKLFEGIVGEKSFCLWRPALVKAFSMALSPCCAFRSCLEA
jgi:hypothetical protein